MTSYCAAVAVDVSFDIIGVTRDRACRVSGEPKEAPSHLPTTTRGHSRLECSVRNTLLDFEPSVSPRRRAGAI